MSKFETRQISFNDKQTVLSGLLLIPTDRKPQAVIILVHGSGAADRDSGGYFVDLRNYFAANGYAILCYDKPGVGLSTGDWTGQSFQDRASEILSAIQFLYTVPALDETPIGLWGGSQAGWIMPIAASLSPEVRFIISVSGAVVISHEQEAFRIERQMQADGFSEAEISKAMDVYRHRISMIRAGEAVDRVFERQAAAAEQSWASYLGCTTREELRFFAKNMTFDPLPHWRNVFCPVLAIWGEADLYVPVHESARRLATTLAHLGNGGFQYRIFPRANHGIGNVQSGTSKEKWRGLVPGYFELMSEWLDKQFAAPHDT